MRLIIGNKNYSSWSFRPWFLLRQFKIDFTETIVPLYRDDTKQALLKLSPSGKVPALQDGENTVWESLAICEYVADKYPDLPAWPKDLAARARARTVSCEMHAGFSALRGEMPMNVRRRPTPIVYSSEVAIDIERICAIWRECRGKYGKTGGFLFGDFSIADAMFAPVIFRFRGYAVKTGPEEEKYMSAMEALPAWKEWTDAALAEPWTIVASER